jgi:hypothetical protein
MSQQNLEENLFFVGILKAVEEKCRIPFRTRNQEWYRRDLRPDPYQMLLIRNTGENEIRTCTIYFPFY